MKAKESTSGLTGGVFTVVLAYAFFAGLWILSSDRAMGLLFSDPETLVRVSMLKGWFFVAVTSLLLYVLVRRLVVQLDAAHQRELAHEREQLQAPAMLAAVADNTDDAIFVKDTAGRYLLFNQAAARFVGKPAEAVLGQDDRALFTPEQAEMLMAIGRRVLATGQTETNEEVIDTAAGRRTFLATKGPLRDAGGKVIGIFGISRDITARKQADDALHASERRFIATFEQAAVGIAHVAPDGRWLRVNRKLCAIVGYSEAELLTKTFQDITHPDDLDSDLDLVRRMLAREIDTYAIDKRYLRKDGSLIWIHLTVALVWQADGTPDYFISVVEDITARKRAETEERQRNAELEHFNRAATERELRMIALKREVNAQACELGRPAPYDLSFAAEDSPPAQP